MLTQDTGRQRAGGAPGTQLPKGFRYLPAALDRPAQERLLDVVLRAVEPIGWRDLTTQAFQLLAIAAGALLLVPARLFRTADDGEERSVTPVLVMVVIAVAALAWVYGATHGQGHHA